MQITEDFMIQELVDNLDEKLLQYFESTKDYEDYGTKDIKEMIRSIVEKIPQAPDTLTVFSKKLKENRIKRRILWVKRNEDNYRDYPPKDPRSWFNHLYYKCIYDKEKNVDSAIEEMFSAMKLWKKSKGYFVTFPNWPRGGANISERNSLIEDLTVCIVDYIINEYNGNINNFSLKQPVATGFGVFASSKQTVSIERKGDELVGDVYRDGEMTQQYILTNDDLDKLEYFNEIPVLDQVDKLILSYLINNCYFELKNITLTSQLQPQTTTLQDLCRAIYGKHHNSRQKNNILSRLYRFRMNIRTQFEGISQDTAILSELVVQKVDDVDVIRYNFANSFLKSIIDKKIMAIIYKNYRSVSQYGQAIYTVLQAARITLGANNVTVQSYSYDFFFRGMLLTQRNVAAKKKIVESALKEVLEVGDIIKDYAINKGVEIVISYVPLSEYERSEYITDCGSFSIDIKNTDQLMIEQEHKDN